MDNRNASNHPEYTIWVAMRRRCTSPEDPRFESYGGRGITVCARWLDSFWQFLEDMGDRPSEDYSVDRLDNDLGYSPDNCRWTTREDQQRNKRNNRRVEYRGEVLTLVEWAEKLKIPFSTLKWRLNNDWPVEKAFTRGRYQSSFSESDIKDIIARAVEKNESPGSICQDYGVSRLTVWRLIRKHKQANVEA